MNPRLGIFSAGGLARAVASHFMEQYIITVFVDQPRIAGEQIQGIPVTIQVPSIPMKYVIACGDPKRKRDLAETIVKWATLLHSSATVSRHADIGEGSIICPGVVIDPEVNVGRHVYVDHNAVIGHGAKVGDYTVISPLVLVAGYCEIGEGVYVGTGAKIVKKACVGDNAVIGAGAVVICDVPPNSVWAGVPAKQIKANPA